MGFEIPKAKNLEQKIFNIRNGKEFEEIALGIFQFQYLTNPLYKSYCEAVNTDPSKVQSIYQIPFLPIQFFKSYSVRSGSFDAEIVFKSSGTTGQNTSQHFVKEVGLYRQSFSNCFELFYGSPKNLCVLGLLPSYLEREGSSLIYMVEDLVKNSGQPLSGFYLYDHLKLKETLLQLETQMQPTILFGVSYALLEFAEAFPLALKHVKIVETGGMKGKRTELSKTELYHKLQNSFSVNEIHSEYGMTELLSQAYAVNGLYKSPPWMKVLVREETDPFAVSAKSGGINVIDLANIYSCSFIATDDLGKLHSDGSFEVLGRMDNSDVRGCSQLIL